MHMMTPVAFSFVIPFLFAGGAALFLERGRRVDLRRRRKSPDHPYLRLEGRRAEDRLAVQT